MDAAIGENEWNHHSPITNFYNHWPNDTGQAQNQTEVKMTYDDQNLYILAKCYDNGERIVQSLTRDRDEDYWGSDNFSVALDPVNTKPGFQKTGTTNGHQKQHNFPIIGLPK